MALNLQKMSITWRIGALLSLLAATVVAENLHAFQAEAATEAADMLQRGMKVEAAPRHAVERTTIAVGFGFRRAFLVHYEFADAQGKSWTGGGNVTEEEFAALADPARPDVVHPAARLTVLYDPADPTHNGLRSAYEAESGPIVWMVVAAFIIVLGTGLALTWRADRLRTRAAPRQRTKKVS